MIRRGGVTDIAWAPKWGESYDSSKYVFKFRWFQVESRLKDVRGSPPIRLADPLLGSLRSSPPIRVSMLAHSLLVSLC